MLISAWYGRNNNFGRAGKSLGKFPWGSRGVSWRRRNGRRPTPLSAAPSFVARGLASLGVPRAKVRVVPYGVEPSRFAKTRSPAPLMTAAGLCGCYLRGRRFPAQGSAIPGASPGRAAPRQSGHAPGGTGDHPGALPAAAGKPGWNLPARSLEPRCAAITEWADVFVFPSICKGRPR